MLVKEYRICMPLTTEEYRIGQLYTISKHSHQESDRGEGVEVMENREHHDPVHGSGQYTEKRVHLSSKLPSWARAVVPRIFYICEKAWNYYPYTVTALTSLCSSESGPGHYHMQLLWLVLGLGGSLMPLIISVSCLQKGDHGR
ncbi:hypothetical protein XELAEV_18047837mg [Xenopus laevis]|uniref:Phosphatidylinositol transfer protein N-terminal domain-containing protein n=1 Tax=Xenopus laevis TaxID=8355 RepID=A0A974BVT2_XENLA|nr:hypothetical protein XELAEV_18047837mg [Xenopus laevis]